MKFTKIAAVVLAGAMLLTGCGQKKEEGTKAGAPTFDTTKTAMTIGDVNVSAGLFNFYFNSFMRQTDDKDKAKEAALEQCENNLLILAVAQAKGVTFDEDKQKEIDDYKQSVVDSYDGGYEDFLNENGLTDEDIDTIISVGYYAEELEKEVDQTEYTDDEKRDYFKNHYRRAKHILISVDDDTDDAAAKKQAEELLNRAKNGEDFDALITEFSKDPGSASNPDGYVFTDNEMVQEFQDGVDSIGYGEFTLVKSDYGYHVIERLALDETPEYFEEQYTKNADSVATVMENNRFEEQVHAWEKEYNIETKVDDAVINEIVNAA